MIWAPIPLPRMLPPALHKTLCTSNNTGDRVGKLRIRTEPNRFALAQVGVIQSLALLRLELFCVETVM
jgi:hypothetical protein